MIRYGQAKEKNSPEIGSRFAKLGQTISARLDIV